MWNLISPDGFFEGTEPWSLDWFQGLFDDELERNSLEQLHFADALVFGRAAYEGWPHIGRPQPARSPI
jgi:dihydrofolate reductase